MKSKSRVTTCRPVISGLRRERVNASAHFRDGRFQNSAPISAGLKGNPLPTLGEYFFAKQQRTPPYPLPLDDPRGTWQQAPASGLRVTWLGHSTTLAEIDGMRVLLDPVFGERASPVSFVGPKRFHRVPATIADLPKLDVVLISHDHYDHLCYQSVLELAKRGVLFVTSLGVGGRLESWGVPVGQIVELDWWEEHVLPGGSLKITAAPAQHFSGRGLDDRNVTSWSSWAIRGARHNIFFSGDTGLTEEFREIGTRLGPFDLAMFEVGAWHPTWGDIHLGPENALKAHALLGSGIFMPVHWGTFNLALHAWDEPVETLWQMAEKTKTRLLTPRLGAPTEPSADLSLLPWWRELGDPKRLG